RTGSSELVGGGGRRVVVHRHTHRGEPEKWLARVPEDDHGVIARDAHLELAIAVDYGRAHDGWITTHGRDASLEVERIDNRRTVRLRRRRQKERRPARSHRLQRAGLDEIVQQATDVQPRGSFRNRSTPSGEGVALLARRRWEEPADRRERLADANGARQAPIHSPDGLA